MILYSLDKLYSGNTILCNSCEGRGYRDIIDDPDSGYIKNVTCSGCNGVGRVKIRLEKIKP